MWTHAVILLVRLEFHGDRGRETASTSWRKLHQMLEPKTSLLMPGLSSAHCHRRL